MDTVQGVIVPMMTPFDNEGRINEKEVRRLVDFLIKKGVDGIFPVSSVGEYVHLDMGERKYLIDIVTDENKGRVNIIPGSGATCYQKSIEIANYAEEKGCTEIILHGPYFYNNTSEVVENHIRKVAESVNIPIFVYNIPLFANNVTPEIIEKLCDIPNVVGVKESSGSMINIMNLLEMTMKINPDFRIFIGNEEMFLPVLLMGGNGCMSAIAGILPEFMTGIYSSFKNKNIYHAYALQLSILPIIREMKSVNFPQGFKEAMSIRGIGMGPPKMNYNSKDLSEIADLKTRLEIEMNDLLYKYFSGSPLKYKEENQYLEKFQCPIKNNSNLISSIKKHEDCNMCGMCDGDTENEVSDNNKFTCEDTSLKPKNQSGIEYVDLDRQRLEDIIINEIKKLIK